MMINKPLDSLQQINAANAPPSLKQYCPHRDYLCDVNNSRRESSKYEEAADRHDICKRKKNYAKNAYKNALNMRRLQIGMIFVKDKKIMPKMHIKML